MPASGPIGEERRVALMNRLIDALGEEEARTLMESLPLIAWHDLATKDDVRASEERLRTETAAQFTKVYAELHSLRTETAAEFTKVYAELHSLRTETAAEFKSVRSDMALQFARQTRTMVYTMLGLAMPTWGGILAVGLG